MKSFIITDNTKGATYNADSVNQSIASHNRRSRNKIGKGEAKGPPKSLTVTAILAARSLPRGVYGANASNSTVKDNIL